MCDESPEAKEKRVLTEYITARVRGLLKVNREIVMEVVGKYVMPLLRDDTRHDFQRLYEEAQITYLAELDDGRRLGHLEYALKQAEGTLKKLGCTNLITMEDEDAEGKTEDTPEV